MRAAFAAHRYPSVVNRQSGPVRPLTGQRIEDVRDRRDATGERYLVPQRVAAGNQCR